MVGLESQPLDVPQAHLSDAQGKTANLSPAGSRLSGGVCITGKVSVFCNGQDSQGTLVRALSRRVPGGGVVCFAGGARLPAVPMNCGGLFRGPFQADGLELQAENRRQSGSREGPQERGTTQIYLPTNKYGPVPQTLRGDRHQQHMLFYLFVDKTQSHERFINRAPCLLSHSTWSGERPTPSVDFQLDLINDTVKSYV